MHKERNGFALVVVLVGLAVLATLFSVIQLRSLSAVTRCSTDRTLLAREAEGTALLRLAGAALARDPAVTRVDLPAPWTGRLVLQNTGGLVDLNMALPDLIDTFARGLDLSPDAPNPAAAANSFAIWHHPPAPAAPRYLGTLGVGINGGGAVLERN